MDPINQKLPKKPTNDDQVNELIISKELRVVSDKGEQLGILTKEEALKQAYALDLDLLVVAPDAKPPVAKMIDYSKYRYDQQKKLKEIKKNQKITQIKEVRLSPTIQKHDFDTKVRAAQKFLLDGDKVKVSIRFQGRMIVHSEVGKKVMVEFSSALEEISTIESQPKLDGKSMVMVMAPKNEK